MDYLGVYEFDGPQLVAKSAKDMAFFFYGSDEPWPQWHRGLFQKQRRNGINSKGSFRGAPVG